MAKSKIYWAARRELYVVELKHGGLGRQLQGLPLGSFAEVIEVKGYHLRTNIGPKERIVLEAKDERDALKLAMQYLIKHVKSDAAALVKGLRAVPKPKNARIYAED